MVTGPSIQMGSSTESLPIASRSRASLSGETDTEKNVDSLFKVYTIAEVTKTLSKLKYRLWSWNGA